ncbi:MAG: polymer-forming cytoskeletal protein [Hyphomonadaceae bacterium]|nr:polymer-forming cytoskeletal protein [Hyphomonadaceae bacterium]
MLQPFKSSLVRCVFVAVAIGLIPPASAQTPEAPPPKTEEVAPPKPGEPAPPVAAQAVPEAPAPQAPADKPLEPLPERRGDFEMHMGPPRAVRETSVLGLGALMGQRIEITDRDGAVAAMAEEITIPGRVGGDVFAAGREISIAGAVDGDLRAMGERVLLNGQVRGDASLAGQDLEVNGAVERELHAAGQSVRVNESARVGGKARLAGQDVEARGRFAGDVTAAAETVLIDAAIAGDLSVRARRITLGPNADITGRFEWRAAESPRMDPAAQVRGGTEGEVGDWRDKRIEVSPGAMRAFGDAARVGFALMWALTAFLIGMVIALAAPDYYDRAIAGLRARPLPALGWGLLMLFAPLALAIVLMATLIGIPLGLFTLFAYPIFLAAGYALGAAAFAALLVRGRHGGARIGALALGLVIFGALALVPWVGGAVALVAMWLGLGLLVIGARRDAPTPAAA